MFVTKILPMELVGKLSANNKTFHKMNNETHSSEIKSQEQMLAEIYENTRKTKQYMKWQLIVTVGLVVIPFVAALIIIPMILSSVTSMYGGVLQ